MKIKKELGSVQGRGAPVFLMLYKRILIGVVANKELFFKMETGGLIIQHGRCNKRIGNNLVIKMTIDALVM